MIAGVSQQVNQLLAMNYLNTSNTQYQYHTDDLAREPQPSYFNFQPPLNLLDSSQQLTQFNQTQIHQQPTVQQNHQLYSSIQNNYQQQQQHHQGLPLNQSSPQNEMLEAFHNSSHLDHHHNMMMQSNEYRGLSTIVERDHMLMSSQRKSSQDDQTLTALRQEQSEGQQFFSQSDNRVPLGPQSSSDIPDEEELHHSKMLIPNQPIVSQNKKVHPLTATNQDSIQQRFINISNTPSSIVGY